MMQLPSKHPEVHEYFMKGIFAVQLGDKNPFGRIPVDQTTEETVNKDTQTSGGTKGFSLKPSALNKYYLTAEYRSKFHLREMTGKHRSSFSHADLHKPRIKRDKADVKAVLDLLENNWVNPLSPDGSELVSLSYWLK